jgi:hypothetical protein
VNGWLAKGQIVPFRGQRVASLCEPGHCDEKITVIIKRILVAAKGLDCAAAAF